MVAVDLGTFGVMMGLIRKLVDRYLRVDRAAGRFMALVVEKNCEREGFEAVYSFSHYGQLNGDLMADPDMTFGLLEGKLYPLSFRNDYLGYYREVIVHKDDGTMEVDEELQRELAEFAAMWFRNVVIQLFQRQTHGLLSNFNQAHRHAVLSVFRCH